MCYYPVRHRVLRFLKVSSRARLRNKCKSNILLFFSLYQRASQCFFSTHQQRLRSSAANFEAFFNFGSLEIIVSSMFRCDSESRFPFGGGVAPASQPLTTNAKQPCEHLGFLSSIELYILLSAYFRTCAAGI
jgi:hypothetical protein